MNYDLKKPCAECPFRNDRPGYLTKARAREIANGLDPKRLGAGGSFGCHKTTVPDPDDDGERTSGPKTQHCAGALIMLEKMGRLDHNQSARFAMRFGQLNPDLLEMDSPVHATTAAFIGAQR